MMASKQADTLLREDNSMVIEDSGLEEPDRQNRFNPQFVAEYASGIHSHLREVEVNCYFMSCKYQKLFTLAIRRGIILCNILV
jgi:hypothetical protein